MPIVFEKLSMHAAAWRQVAASLAIRGAEKTDGTYWDAAVLVGGIVSLAATGAHALGGGAGLVMMAGMAVGAACAGMSWPREGEGKLRGMVFRAGLTALGASAIGLMMCCQASDRVYQKNLDDAVRGVFAGQDFVSADFVGRDWMRGFGAAVRDPVQARLIEKSGNYHLILIESDGRAPSVLSVVPETDPRRKSPYRSVIRAMTKS